MVGAYINRVLCIVVMYLSATIFSKPKPSTYPKKRLKILVVVTYFPEVTSTAALNLITGLIERGCDVFIYALYKGPIEWSHPDIAKYRLLEKAYYHDPVPKRSIILPTSPHAKKLKKNLKNLPANLNSFDIIFCQYGYRGLEFIPVKKRLPQRVKLVTCFRGADLSRYVKEDKHLYDELFLEGDLFLPVCDFFKNRLISLGCSSRKIKTHHSAIDCTFFKYQPHPYRQGEPIILVTVARLDAKKGIEYAIQAVALLVKRYPRILYKIVGFGPLQQEYQNLIDRLGARNNIILVGRASQEEVVSHLASSHIFILPSVTDAENNQEGIPNALKEAMAIGLPVITTYEAGIPELVKDGVEGFLVEQKDVYGLAERIDHLIKHPEIWEKMGKNGREKIEKEYEKNSLNNTLLALFEALVRTKGIYDDTDDFIEYV
ncbi:MAG TPA: glycosyltransferase [Candidatus Bathyarchaeia archaeon]|nr:glycosyltransferase [Candidatus Bathyarchaeia archaeon]